MKNLFLFAILLLLTIKAHADAQSLIDNCAKTNQRTLSLLDERKAFTKSIDSITAKYCLDLIGAAAKGTYLSSSPSIDAYHVLTFDVASAHIFERLLKEIGEQRRNTELPYLNLHRKFLRGEVDCRTMRPEVEALIKKGSLMAQNLKAVCQIDECIKKNDGICKEVEKTFLKLEEQKFPRAHQGLAYLYEKWGYPEKRNDHYAKFFYAGYPDLAIVWETDDVMRIEMTDAMAKWIIASYLTISLPNPFSIKECAELHFKDWELPQGMQKMLPSAFSAADWEKLMNHFVSSYNTDMMNKYNCERIQDVAKKKAFFSFIQERPFLEEGVECRFRTKEFRYQCTKAKKK